MDEVVSVEQKEAYRAFAAANNVQYVDKDGKYVMFQREVNKPTRPVPGEPGRFYVGERVYELYRLFDSDIQDGSGAYMIRRGLTRTL